MVGMPALGAGNCCKRNAERRPKHTVPFTLACSGVLGILTVGNDLPGEEIGKGCSNEREYFGQRAKA